MALLAVLSQSLMENHQLRVRNSHWKSEVRVENCSPLGVISHPNQPILGHWHSISKCLVSPLIVMLIIYSEIWMQRPNVSIQPGCQNGKFIPKEEMRVEKRWAKVLPWFLLGKQNYKVDVMARHWNGKFVLKIRMDSEKHWWVSSPTWIDIFWMLNDA